MKRLLYILPIFTLLAGMVGCGENDDFSSPHILTDEEIAYQKYLDSLESAKLAAGVQADLILEYSIISNPATDWSTTELYIDSVSIGETFGISASDVITKINNGDITCYAINKTTNSDVMKATNTNGVWGHWWSKVGDICDTYNQETPSPSAFFAEWDGHKFSVGQFPGHCAVGDTIIGTECLKYQSKRVAVVIKYIVSAYNDPETAPSGTPENTTQDLTITKAYSTDYATESYDVKDILRNTFKMTTYQIKQAAANGNIKVYLGEVTETDPVYTTDGLGYWIDESGASSSYATTLPCFATLSCSNTELTLMVGNGPAFEYSSSDYSQTFKLIVSDGTVSATLNVTFAITSVPVKVDINPVLKNTYKISLNLPANEDYSLNTVAINIADILSDINLTDASKIIALTKQSDGTYVKTYNADNGFWYGADGNIGSYGTGTRSVFSDFSDISNGNFKFGYMPGSTIFTVGQSIIVPVYLWNSTTQDADLVNVNITLTDKTTK